MQPEKHEQIKVLKDKIREYFKDFIPDLRLLHKFKKDREQFPYLPETDTEKKISDKISNDKYLIETLQNYYNLNEHEIKGEDKEKEEIYKKLLSSIVLKFDNKNTYDYHENTSPSTKYCDYIAGEYGININNDIKNPYEYILAQIMPDKASLENKIEQEQKPSNNSPKRVNRP